METKYTIRNQETGQVYIDNAKSFTEAVEASEFIETNNIEMVKTTQEIIYFHDKKGNYGSVRH